MLRFCFHFTVNFFRFCVSFNFHLSIPLYDKAITKNNSRERSTPGRVNVVLTGTTENICHRGASGLSRRDNRERSTPYENHFEKMGKKRNCHRNNGNIVRINGLYYELCQIKRSE